jgi:hypothetical protein
MTGRLMFRVLRWAALAAVAPVLWACNARTLEKPTLMPDQTYAKNFQSAVNRNVDLLFMIDDSTSMAPLQTLLLNNFPTFMTTLQNGTGGLPNLHVAVVSSDLGAGYGDVVGCGASNGLGDPGGDKGIFQYTAKTANVPAGTDCAGNALNAGAAFISNVAGQANYTGNLATVFTCIAALGGNGCGFEHQFGAVLRALGADGRPAPQENAGFLRPEAYLVIIFITNEDDCTSIVEPQFFDIQSNWSQGSQLGETFRCNEFGHLCTMGGGAAAHPNRNAPNNDVTATVNYDGCTSDEAGGYLLSVRDTADALKRVKPNAPDMVLFASIQGAPTPYQVHWKPPTMADSSCGAASCPWPEVTHSCVQGTNFADPGVRTAQLVTEFGGNGLLLSICDASFAPALTQIGNLINAKLQPPCITQMIQQDANGLPLCNVVNHVSNGNNGFIDTVIPNCNGNSPPCWQLRAPTAGETCAGQIVDVMPDPNVSTGTGQNATVNCSLVPP